MSSNSVVRIGVLSAVAVWGCGGSAAQDAEGAGGDGGTDASVITPAVCATMCGIVSQVPCPGSPDTATCTQSCLAKAGVCSTQEKAYYDCIMMAGPSVLVCETNPPGLMVRSGSCVKEVMDVEDCLL
jgi:hypothetical protein